LTYQSGLTFFGLTPAYKKILLEEIFLLCYHGNGGWTHDEVYNLPVRYRHYYIQKISETAQKQQEEMDNKFKFSNGKEQPTQPSKKPTQPPPIPDFAFTTKAPKK
jgi:hypothetical protein